ncbi:unnamed protein product [marine sediment metagenome]|uniref:Uncharacterized protein n=1 Tax=marine sediment metagenome TaxID=412755 RepID=X0VPX1_9ZZZZ
MAVSLDIRATNIGPLIKALRKFDRVVSEPATANALNRTINVFRKEAMTIAMKQMGVKKDQLKRKGYRWKGPAVAGFYTTRARANKRSHADLNVDGGRHNLVKYNAVATKDGVMHNAGGELRIDNALRMMGRGTKRFVVRKTATGEVTKAKRFDSSTYAYGPGASETLMRAENTEHLFEYAAEQFEALWIKSANHQLARRGYRVRIT